MSPRVYNAETFGMLLLIMLACAVALVAALKLAYWLIDSWRAWRADREWARKVQAARQARTGVAR